MGPAGTGDGDGASVAAVAERKGVGREALGEPRTRAAHPRGAQGREVGKGVGEESSGQGLGWARAAESTGAGTARLGETFPET